MGRSLPVVAGPPIDKNLSKNFFEKYLTFSKESTIINTVRRASEGMPHDWYTLRHPPSRGCPSAWYKHTQESLSYARQKSSSISLLTSIKICGIITTKEREGKPKPNQKGRYTMRKNTLSTIASILTNIDFENKTEIMDELMKDINRGVEAKASKMAEYDAAVEPVMNVLRMTTAPLTVAEIFDACEGLPEGFTKNKVSYGLTHYWADRVVKVEGKVNTYRLPV